MVPVLRALLLLGFLLGTLARAQQPWTNVDSPTTRTLWGIVHASPLGEPGQFIAVGEAGTIVTSPDGVNWAARNSGTDRWLLDVTWSPTLKVFVVAGEAGTLLTSADGINWTSRNSGTTQRLNSVAWAPKRFTHPDVFLAVGENGTALISFDLETWTPRATGVSGWLRGIASSRSGPDRFIVTGHDGTILLTEDAGETWSRPASGTTLHLDAVTSRGNAGFYATGANFVLTRTSDSGRTWTLDRTVNTDGHENGIVYNGLVWFNEALVAVGDQGRIIDEAGRLWGTSEPLLAGWRAVAASPNRVVAVGTAGSIASAPLDPHLSLEHDIAVSFLSDSILLTATKKYENRSLGFTIQWSVNGEPIPGAKSLTLRLNTAAGAQSGTYTFTATAGDAAAFSTSVTLDPQPNPAALGLVDLDFRPSLSAAPGPIAIQPDGRILVASREPAIYVGGRRLNGPVRLAADGSLDTTFSVADAVLIGTPRSILLQPDGRIVVVERVDGTPRYYRAVRLNPNGSADQTFRPDPMLVASGDPPILLADGRWLSVERQYRPGGPVAGYGASAFASILRRFEPDGRLDTAFAPIELMAGSTIANFAGLAEYFTGQRSIHTRDAQSRVYLGVQHGDFTYSQAAGSGTSRLFRLLADGTPDPTFTPRDVGPLHTIVATTTGLMARTVNAAWARMQPSRTDTALFRLNFEGTPDSGYRTWTRRTQRFSAGPAAGAGLGSDYDVVAVLPDGAIITRTLGHHGHFGLVRFDPRGDLDRNFNAELGATSSGVTQVHPLPNGKLLLAGTFRSLLDVPQPFLAQITPNTQAATVHLANVSVRARVDAAAGPLIVGFVTAGGDTRMLTRAAGPALATFGVASPLADPQLRLFNGPTEIAVNDDWDPGPAGVIAATAARLGAFPFPPGSADAALYTAGPAGAFTIQVGGAADTAGVALAEIYHADPAPADAAAPRVINFSVRTVAGTEADTLTAGFVLRGRNTRNILIRALGPGLARFGVMDPLPDPVVTLFRGNMPIASNDDWAVNVDTWRTLSEAFAATGAFPLSSQPPDYMPRGDRDAALLISLAPGSYTVQVTGKAGATGTALVEIYEVP